jgi:acetyl-CoA carboxylase biotin carboxyl carrier protein
LSIVFDVGKLLQKWLELLYLLRFAPEKLGGVFLLGKDTAMAHKSSDLQRIKELLKIMKDNDLVELELKHGDDKVVLKRAWSGSGPSITSVPIITAGLPATFNGAGMVGAGAAGQAQPAVEAKDNLTEIKSPIVGTLYSAPSPDSDTFVEVGSHIEEQSVICIIEAMKVMNEIRAETSGTIVEILAKDGQAVEYGQVLFKVKPD